MGGMQSCPPVWGWAGEGVGGAGLECVLGATGVDAPGYRWGWRGAGLKCVLGATGVDAHGYRWGWRGGALGYGWGWSGRDSVTSGFGWWVGDWKWAGCNPALRCGGRRGGGGGSGVEVCAWRDRG